MRMLSYVPHLLLTVRFLRQRGVLLHQLYPKVSKLTIKGPHGLKQDFRGKQNLLKIL